MLVLINQHYVERTFVLPPPPVGGIWKESFDSSTPDGLPLDMKNEMQDEFPFTWQEICGAGRDLGPYEYEGGAATGAQMLLKRATDLELTLCQGNIVFSVPSDGKVVVDVLNAQGMGVTPAICLLAAGGAEYSFPAPQLPGGVYFARLTHRGMSRTMKMVVR